MEVPPSWGTFASFQTICHHFYQAQFCNWEWILWTIMLPTVVMQKCLNSSQFGNTIQSALWTNRVVVFKVSKNHPLIMEISCIKQYKTVPYFIHPISCKTNVHRSCLTSWDIMTYLSTAGTDSLSSNGKPSWADKDFDMPCHKRETIQTPTPSPKHCITLTNSWFQKMLANSSVNHST